MGVGNVGSPMANWCYTPPFGHPLNARRSPAVARRRAAVARRNEETGTRVVGRSETEPAGGRNEPSGAAGRA
jgi:hypothetical protein